MRWLMVVLAGMGTIGACARSPAPEEDSVLRQRLGAQAPLQWQLPLDLREISGLALDDSGSLFAIDDERAVIHQLDYENGGLRRRFAVGSPTLRGDFEGLAAVGDTLYALTSEGTLLRFPVGEDGDRVKAELRDTGLGERCEFEGLTYDRGQDALLLACKRVLVRGRKRQVHVYRWPLQAGSELSPPLVIDEDILAAAVDAEDFQPSAIAIDETDNSLWLLAARQRAVARLTVSSPGKLQLLEATVLPFAQLHRQSEGLALTEGLIMIADEGGKQRGRLARYERP